MEFHCGVSPALVGADLRVHRSHPAVKTCLSSAELPVANDESFCGFALSTSPCREVRFIHCEAQK